MTLASTSLTLAGCTFDGDGKPSGADQDRLAVMQREPLLKQATRPPSAQAGFRVSDTLPVHRSKILANLVDATEADPAHAMRTRGTQALTALREGGWTVFHARCEQASFHANAYKIVEKVSYYAELTGKTEQTNVSIFVQLRAPQAAESTSDFFADRPPALPTGRTCLETGAVTGSDGTQIVLDELGPDPKGSPKPAGHR
jgi:hypothetical protein